MNRTRILAIAKLVLLFGTPVALVLGLFSCGVYCGVQNRTGIATFERDWLGLDVEVPGADEVETKDGEGEAKAKDGEGDDGEGDDGEGEGEAEAKDGESGEPKPAGEGDAKQPQPTQPQPQPTRPTQPNDSGQPPVASIPAPVPAPEPRVDPLDGADSDRLGIPVTIKVGVMVDTQFIASHPQWIDAVQRTVSRASYIYQEQFGITLELWTVGRWAVPEQGMSASDLRDDLRGRPRQGADVLLGFTGRTFDGTTADLPPPPAAEDPFNGAYGVVYGTSGHRESHLRPLLHELSRLMGAKDVTDPQDPSWIAGSWMSYAPVAETQAPWIDADNRKRVLERKDKPFAPAPAASESKPESESVAQ